MTESDFALLRFISQTVTSIWTTLSKLVIFGLPITTLMLSALAISIVMPFVLQFTSTAFFSSLSKKVGSERQAQISLQQRAERRSKK
jgi:hypothetical protein